MHLNEIPSMKTLIRAKFITILNVQIGWLRPFMYRLSLCACCVTVLNNNLFYFIFIFFCPDMCAELFQTSPSSSLMFSMFSSGDRRAQDALFLRHTSPLALGPSARMAAGPSLPYWYKKRGLNNPAASTDVFC